MKVFKVNITPRATEDMQEIFEYIAYTLEVPQIAFKLLDRIESEIFSLSSMPEKFRRFEFETQKERNLRIMSVDNYVVLYIVNDEKSEVTVIRILYGGRDIDKQLDNTKF